MTFHGLFGLTACFFHFCSCFSGAIFRAFFPPHLLKHTKSQQITFVCGFFPTCQVRVVRFYQSCSSPLPPPSSFSSSASSSSSTTSASTSTATVALPTLGQALRQLRSSVRTAGPQPGTVPAQCAPLDLNLGPS